MDINLLTLSVAAAVVSGTPILLAASGELIAEKVGVFNVGIEGVMLMGGLAGFVLATKTNSIVLGLLGAALAGIGFMIFFAVPVVLAGADQLVSGIALALLGIGLSNELGEAYVAQPPAAAIDHLSVPLLSQIPFLGRAFFQQLWMVYVAVALPFLLLFILNVTRHGMNLRAIGEDPVSAQVAGISVLRWRFIYVLLSGGLIGLGGAFITLGSVRRWNFLVTGGSGWIALAVVIFANWRPIAIIGAAYLFGGLSTLGIVAQSLGWHIPSQFLSMLPYLGTLAALVIKAWRNRHTPGFNAGPAGIGKAFVRGST